MSRLHQAKSRDSGPTSQTQDVAGERPLKKRRIAFGNEDDMQWMRCEITGMKYSLERMAAEARENRENINTKLQELQELLHVIKD